MPVQETEKALRYIAQLDAARCDGRWQDIPELARKIEKHAPHRACLAFAARSEAQVAAYLSQRPTTATGTTAPTPIAQLIPQLLTTIEQENTYAEDAFVAKVCLGWIHWALKEFGLAVARLPNHPIALLRDHSCQTEWAKICAVKSVYLRGFCQERIANSSEAVETYTAVVPVVPSISMKHGSSQLYTWTARIIVRLCSLFMQSKPLGDWVDLETMLQTFRLWDRISQGSPNRGLVEIVGSHAGRYTARDVWHAYYRALSHLLQNGYVYAPLSNVTTPGLLRSLEEASWEERIAAKLRQRSELKRVETTYETLLLEETRFPKASEKNEEVEEWVDEVMDNWRIMCGPSWHDEELGEGGKGAVSRGVLDILYRAATKTFHSTKILRHLFTVHTSLAEFPLAMKAFDSYIEIVNRSKERGQKTGKDDDGLDDDNTVLRTAADAIRVLCRFGARKEAEKALEIGNNIEKWLRQETPKSSTNKDQGHDRGEGFKATVAPKSLAVAYRAMGISQAHWARLTYDPETRASLQNQAVNSLRRAIDPRHHDPNNLETLYALALLLSEIRDVAGAIKVVKRAFASRLTMETSITAASVTSEDSSVQRNAPFAEERRLIPLWHLLALLLTARSEFGKAAKTCDAAFDQFTDLANLFGNQESAAAYRSEHLNNLSTGSADEKPRSQNSRALVDQMDGFEKERILQVKMTHLALLELLEGSTAAVDSSSELLALYGRLFGDPKIGQAKLQTTGTAFTPPKSASGTIKGSLLGRAKSSRRSAEKQPLPTVPSSPSTMATNVTAAPTIQVTDEYGKVPHEKDAHHHHLHLPFHHHHEHDTQQRSPSVKLNKKSMGSLRKRHNDPPNQQSSVESTLVNPPSTAVAPNGTHAPNESGKFSFSSSERRSAESPDQPLRPIAHNTSHDVQPAPTGHADQPPRQDVRLPAPHPTDDTPLEPRLPTLQERRHKITLLVEVWLFTAGLYNRAGMFEDAKGAIDEAFKLAEGLELETSQEASSSKAFAERGWGGGKSVDELWADVWAQRGELSQARSQPHNALTYFEKALAHFPDHPSAIVGLSNILLDIYAQKISPEPPGTSIPPVPSPPSPGVKSTSIDTSTVHESKPQEPSQRQYSRHSPSPEDINRLTARDRAYNLLSTLTKLGSGWDYSEAWFALARAYEESSQIEKAKEVLWWCVELEDTRPLRKWSSVGPGGFVL